MTVWTPEPSNSASYDDSQDEDSWDPHSEDDVWESDTEGPCCADERSDILWVVTDLPSFMWAAFSDEPYSWIRTWLPDSNDVWNTYYVPGYENDPGVGPWEGYSSHYPWYHNDPGSTPPNDYGHGRFNNIGVSYDHVNKKLTFMQFDDVAYNEYRYNLQVTEIDFSDLDNPVISKVKDWGDAWTWYSPFWEGIEVQNTGLLGACRYCYPGADGQPVLVISSWYGDIGVSYDNGATWIHRPDLGHNYLGPGVYSLSENHNYYSIEYGPPGSDTIALVGTWTIWKSSNLGDTWEISWVSYGAGDFSDPDGSTYGPLENGRFYETYAIGCNKKPDPDCVWMTIGWRDSELDQGIVQRNLSPTLEYESWENTSYRLVSAEYELDIFESTVVYPNDWIVPSQRGQPFIVRCIPTAIKYFPGSGRWWAFCFRENLTLCNPNDSNFLIFSDDDGLTWSKILCDHLNEENWPSMHPFFSPRAWPFSEVDDGWTQCVAMNYTGFGAVCDIVEHPDDPNIIVTVGYHWLRAPGTWDDPAGRGDGTVSFVAPSVTAQELADNPQYGPGLRSLGNYKAVYCVSMDGGLTWGDVSCVMPTWAYPYADYETGEFYTNYYYSANPNAFRIFPIVGAVEGGEATGHEPGWNPAEDDGTWTQE